MNFVYIGVLLNSALYLTGCFVAGLVLQNAFAWRLALAAAGLAYLGYVAQTLGRWGYTAPVFVVVSMVLGVAAGLVLL